MFLVIPVISIFFFLHYFLFFSYKKTKKELELKSINFNHVKASIIKTIVGEEFVSGRIKYFVYITYSYRNNQYKYICDTFSYYKIYYNSNIEVIRILDFTILKIVMVNLRFM